MKKELAKQYSPSEIENRLYAEWTEKGYFRPDRWRIGRTTTYACKKAVLLWDILDFINEK